MKRRRLSHGIKSAVLWAKRARKNGVSALAK